MGVCNCSMFCCTLLYVHSSIAIILVGKRELIALLNLSSWCLVMVERLFLTVPRGCLQFVIVVFPDHTHLLFRHGSQTSDHIFKLKTLISKYLHNSKKFYVCFTDLRKAFDSVLHPALFIKLVPCGLGGNFLSVLRAIYSQIDLQVICNSRGLTEVFQSQLGIFQGDNLIPNLFNIFVNDLTNCFDGTCMPVLLGGHRIKCLLYADDLYQSQHRVYRIVLILLVNFALHGVSI